MKQKTKSGGGGQEQEAGPGVVIFYGANVLAVDVPSGLHAFSAWVTAGPRDPGDPAVLFIRDVGNAVFGFHVDLESRVPVTPHALRDTPGWGRAVRAWVRLKARADADGMTLPDPTLWILPR